MYKTRIKEKWWLSQCGRTWLVCRKQLNTPGVTLNADLEPKTHHQTPMTYGYSHFKTVATEVEIQFLSAWNMFPSLLPQFGSAFSLLKKGVSQYFVHIMNVQVIGVWWWFLAQGLHLKSHQRCSAGIRTCFLQTSQVLPHWLNHHSLWFVLYTQRHCHVE